MPTTTSDAQRVATVIKYIKGFGHGVSNVDPVRVNHGVSLILNRG